MPNQAQNLKPKKIAKKTVFITLLLVLIYLLSQLVVYSFFENSKITKIKTAEMNEKTYDEIKERVHSKNTVKKEWRGNYLIITHYIYLPCNQESYIRYNKDKIEILIIEPMIQCWGEAVAKRSYTIRYNNIISSSRAYLLNKDLLTYEVCEIHEYECMIDGNIITEYQQAENYGFVKLIDSKNINLKNLNYSINNDSLKNSMKIVNQKERNEDLRNIVYGLEKYRNVKNQYPISEDYINILYIDFKNYNRKEYQTGIDRKYLTDPENPEYYYGYKSDGKSYEILMKSENPSSNCKKEQELCVISSGDVIYTNSLQ